MTSSMSTKQYCSLPKTPLSSPASDCGLPQRSPKLRFEPSGAELQARLWMENINRLCLADTQAACHYMREILGDIDGPRPHDVFRRDTDYLVTQTIRLILPKLRSDIWRLSKDDTVFVCNLMICTVGAPTELSEARARWHTIISDCLIDLQPMDFAFGIWLFMADLDNHLGCPIAKAVLHTRVRSNCRIRSVLDIFSVCWVSLAVGLRNVYFGWITKDSTC